MADGRVTVEAVLDTSKVTKNVKNLSKQLGGVSWKGIEGAEGSLGRAAESAGGLSGRLDACAMAAGTFVGNIGSTALTAAVSAIGDLAQGVYDTGAAFEASMANVAALSGATGDELGALEATARQMGASTVFSASEAADALGYMALAGWDSQQSMDALPGVLDLAAASGMGLAEASDMVTDYLTAFGLEASDATRFADMLAYAQANSNTTAAALGEAYKNCAANLNAAGQDVETTTSLLAMMANQGLKGSEAGTALAAIMRDVTAGMQDGCIAIGDTVVAVTDADGNFRDLTDILADVEGATAGMGDAQRAAALAETFTADSTKGLNLLLNAGVGEAASFEESLRGCDGAAGAMAETMNDTLSGDMKTLNSAMEELQLKCYDAVQPALRGVAQTATDELIPAVTDALFGVEQSVPVYDELGTMCGSTQERAGGLIDTLAGMAEQAAPGVEAVGGVLQGMVDTAAPALQGVADAALGMAGTVGGNLADAFDTLQPALESASDFLGGALSGAFETACGVASDLMGGVGEVSGLFTQIADEVGPGLQAFFDGFSLDAVAETFDSVRSSLADNFTPVWETLTSTVVPALGDAFDAIGENVGGFQEMFDTAVGAVGNVADLVFTGVGDVAQTGMQVAGDAIGAVTSAINGDWQGALDGMASVAGDVWTGIGTLSEDIFGVNIADAVSGLCESVGSWWDDTWSSAQDVADSAWGNIQGFIEDPVGSLTGTIGGFTSGVKSQLQSWGIDADVDGVWRSLKGFIDDPVGSLDSTIGSFISGVAGKFSSWGIDSTVDGIFSNVQSFMEDPIGSAQGFISDALGTISSIVTSLDLNLPHFALPHFWVSGGEFPWGIGGSGTPPAFGVDWYAKGGVFNGASVIGVGEAGPEMALPLNPRSIAPFARSIAGFMDEERGDAGGQGQVVYQFGDINVSMGELRDLATLEDFVNLVLAAKRGNPLRSRR